MNPLLPPIKKNKDGKTEKMITNQEIMRVLANMDKYIRKDKKTTIKK